MKITIYCLINPINGKVFYVGATKFSLDVRLKAHLVPYRIQTGAIVTKRCDVYREIRKKNLMPIIIPLEVCTIKNVDAKEAKWYYFYKKQGFNLLQSESAFLYSNMTKR